MVIGKPCSRYGPILRRHIRRLTRAQDSFDHLDYPRGDRLMTRWWRHAYVRFLR